MRQAENMASPRIAMGGFLHETNTFAPSPATLDDFLEGGGMAPLTRGEALFSALAGGNVGLCGFMDAAREQGWTLLPTLWTAASPSAHVTEEAFEHIVVRLLIDLEHAMPLAGVYLDLHGAMVTTHLDDGEGEILRRVRALVGPQMPIVASLDLHGNVTPLMVNEADMLIAYRTYPHIDMAETGRRCAAAMAVLLGQKGRPKKAFRQLDFLMPIAWQCTDELPCRALYADIERLDKPPLLSASFLTGFPAADIPDCGPSVLVYGEDQARVDRIADALVADINAQEAAFAGRVLTPEEGVREAMRLAGESSAPIVIADTQDNPGAGGNSDTMGMLRALIACGAGGAAIGNIFDPQAARAAHKAGVGAMIDLSLGGRSGVEGDAPFRASFVVEALSDGRFVAAGPYYGGARLDMGPSACLRIDDVRVVVVSRKAQMADQAMYRSVGVEPRTQHILVNKSSVHFRADFAPIARAILVCAAPGPMAVDPATLPWQRLRPGIRTSPLGVPFTP
ncbi:M81 family metallopeptidase [Kushneria indalinina]|uniref:Microcystinase C n=1 Tax=Kushneria indalinina DSM 14324 TaxID=1122140 RepID=A0A3D9DUT3_9GAMM|nr:M81 family metallopeptidase [Kushneria indalinina]REC94415.1 microcystin degradation protein MlrC [Kushneria indalinina DSM 14324]